MENKRVLLSIGIVNWNTKALLLNLLHQLEERVPSCPFEIIVVDNASIDGSADEVEKAFPKVLLIRNSRNIGFTRACNQIMKVAKGEFLLLLNTDLIIPDGGIDALVKFMQQHEDAALCGPKLVYPDGSLQASVRSFHTLLTVFWELIGLDRIFPKSHLFGRYLMTYWDHNDVREVDFVSGAVYMMRKKAINDVGLFDERYFLYVQDADWSYRAKKKGWKVYYVPNIVFVHMEGQSIKRIGGIKNYWSNIDRLRFFHNHYGINKARALYLMTYYVNYCKRLIGLFLGRNKYSDDWFKWLSLYRDEGRRIIRKWNQKNTP